ncbi:MAG TPA: hypothetical protein VJ464_09730 [Blastocatellia bacterium]|nr:hypothetical protein [Blastocatellia bacterium]
MPASRGLDVIDNGGDVEANRLKANARAILDAFARARTDSEAKP